MRLRPLLDEPTSGVDEGARRKLRDLFRIIQRELTFTAWVVDHDPRFVAEVASCAIVLARGAGLADGPTAEVLDNPRVIESFLGIKRAATLPA